MRIRDDRRGFTLMELIVVTIILAVLSAITLPAIMKVKEKANIAKAASTIDTLKVALSMYQMDWGFYPQSFDGSNQHNGNSGTPAYGTTLIEALLSTERNGPYYEVKRPDLVYGSGTDNPILLDPWGQAYVYVSRCGSVTEGDDVGPWHPFDDSGLEADLDRNTYNIYSFGPDKVTNGWLAHNANWDQLDLFNAAADGDWASATSSSDGNWDDINSQDGKPSHQ